MPTLSTRRRALAPDGARTSCVPACRAAPLQRALASAIRLCAATLSVALILASCATDITAHATPAALVERQADEVYRLNNEVVLDLVVGRVRKPLPSGSSWKAVGTIPEGNVYKPLDHLLQVQTGHSYEAFLVCSQERIIGVFLPVEDSFVAVKQPIPIHLEVNE